MWEYLKNTNKPILLYGMGNNADRVLDRLLSMDVIPAGVFASDGFVRGQSFRGYRVLSYSEAKERFGSMVVLLCFGSQLKDVMEVIIKIAAEQELFVPDMPLAGEELFDTAFAHEHREKINRVYNLLADGQSRFVFERVIKFKLDGKLPGLLECETPPEEAYKNILRPSKSEVFMDLGAYNGDTVRQFLSFAGGYKKIYAIEPDGKNFKKLQSFSQQLDNFICINAAVSHKSGSVTFSAKNGRSSAVSSDGEAIPAVCIDGISAGEDISYIKMDVEGAEAAAIDGGVKTIERCKPKMLISCYHRSRDMFDIPLRVLAIRDDYKVYMRHYPYIPAWDTAFYFV